RLHRPGRARPLPRPRGPRPRLLGPRPDPRPALSGAPTLRAKRQQAPEAAPARRAGLLRRRGDARMGREGCFLPGAVTAGGVGLSGPVARVGSMEKSSVYADGEQEALRFKWIESEKAG